ncbi:MAG: amidohydrolase family protein [Vitreimonas sp.]
MFGTRRSFLAGGAAACMAACATPSAGAALAILGARIVDPAAAGAHARADVFARDGRIEEVAHAVAPPRGAVVVDATGKFLTPGLWDMHAHIAPLLVGRAPENYVGWGVLGIRDCGGQLDAMLQLRREIAAGRVGPELYIAGPTLNGEQLAPHHRVIADAEQARAAVRELKAAGVDFIKTHRRTPRAAFFALVEEARAQGLAVAGHVPLEVTWDEAIAAGMSCFEHTQTMLENEVSAGGDRAASLEAAVARFDGERLDQLAAALVRAGAYFDPTLIQYETSIDARPEAAARRRELYNRLKSYVGRLHRAGVPLLSGSDVLDRFGEMALAELDRLASCGLGPRDVLRSATTTPARWMGRPEQGRIVRGASASFLIVDGDPASDVANLRRPSAVVLKGRLLDAAALAGLRQA